MCTFGTSPASMPGVTSQFKVSISGQTVATIQDNGFPVCVAPMGMCSSLANPAVASATAAALGVLTPQPCVPATVAPWICMSKVFVGGKPVLTNDGKLMCAYGGVITINMPAQMKVMLG